jgi:hypothetical protein
LECEGWGEACIGRGDVGEQDAVGLEGITREEEVAGGDGVEVGTAFKDGRTSATAFGGTVADEEAGDVAFDEPLVEVDEQVVETFVGAALGTSEHADEWIDDDKMGIDAFDGRPEAGQVFWEREGMMTTGVELWGLFLDEGDDLDFGKVGSEVFEDW